MMPDPCPTTMWRAAAREVVKLVRSPLATARKRLSVAISVNGSPCTSPRQMNEVEGDVDAACLRDHGSGVLFDGVLLARASRASRAATSAEPPADLMSSATASSFSRVRPARKTLAPSRAYSLATGPPIDPPAP